jgi:hypothetical protein
MNLRMAGRNLGILGAGAAAGAGGLALAQFLAEQAVPITGAAMPDSYWEANAAVPGNSWVLPHQATEHAVGDARWQYPFFRADLVRAGLLPSEAPAGNPAEIRLPKGMSVLQAIEEGVIR